MALSDFQILQHGPGQEDAPWPYEAQLYFARQIEAEARRDALEEAAQKCESQWSNVAEKMYGAEMAAAIRALKESPPPTA